MAGIKNTISIKEGNVPNKILTNADGIGSIFFMIDDFFVSSKNYELILKYLNILFYDFFFINFPILFLSTLKWRFLY